MCNQQATYQARSPLESLPGPGLELLDVSSRPHTDLLHESTASVLDGEPSAMRLGGSDTRSAEVPQPAPAHSSPPRHSSSRAQIMAPTLTPTRSSSAVAFTVLGLLQGAASFGLEATLTYDFRGSHYSLAPKPQWSTADISVVDVAAAGAGVCETQGFDQVHLVQSQPPPSRHAVS